MKNGIEFVVFVLASFLLWSSVDVGRKSDSKIRFLSGEWWLIFLLLLFGMCVFKYSDDIVKLILN